MAGKPESDGLGQQRLSSPSSYLTEHAMPKSGMVVREYLEQLKETKRGKPPQIRDALDIYVEMWEKVIKKGAVSEEDEVGAALSKLDEVGGLRGVAED